MDPSTALSKRLPIHLDKKFVIGFLCEKCGRKQLNSGELHFDKTYHVETDRQISKAYDKAGNELNATFEKAREGLASGNMSCAQLDCSCRYCGHRAQWADYCNRDRIYKYSLLASNGLTIVALLLLFIHMMSSNSILLYGAIAVFVCALLALVVPRILVSRKNKAQDKLVQQMNHEYWPVLLGDEASQREYLRGESAQVLAEYGFVPETEVKGGPV